MPRKCQEEHNKGEKKAHVLRVRVLLLLLLLLLVRAGGCCVARYGCGKFGSVLVQVKNRYRFFLQQSEFRGGQSPHHLSPIFQRHPRHLGRVFLYQ